MESRIGKILKLTENLPYFGLETLAPVERDKTYLKILLARQVTARKLFRLKRGVYVSKAYIDNTQKKGVFSYYSEFLASILYGPSYLSLDYVLYKNNILSDIPVNLTSVTRNKTAVFSNSFGNFFYHKMKEKLFCGFTVLRQENWTIFTATKTKALFDYVYLRKNSLINERTVQELRLNRENLNSKDLRELKSYLQLESSEKMSQIFDWLLK